MGILQQSTIRVTMEAVRVMMTAALLLGGAQCRPQQLTQEVLLTPFNFVRSTGNTALTTGQQVIQSVPEAVNAVSDTAVTSFTVDSINSVPQTINTVSDFTVDNIRNAPANTIRFVNGVPGALVRAPGTVISASSSGIRTVATDGVNMFTQIPANALQFTGTAFRTGEALVTGGTRLALATGDSLIRSGLNTLGGGGRILFATAGVPFNLA